MPPSPLGPPYRIVTPRLVLRCWEPADTPALMALIARNLEFFRRWLYWAEDEPLPLEAKLHQVRHWRAAFDADQAWSYAAFSAEDGALAGGMVLFRRPVGSPAIETGGWYGKEFNGRGFHTEASAAATRVAFEVLGAPRVQTTCMSDNAASIAVRRKLGFVHEGNVRHITPEGQRLEEMQWSLLADEWAGTPAAAMAADARAYDALGNRLF